MNQRIKILLAALAFALIATSCNLPTRVQTTPTTPLDQFTPVPAATAAPAEIDFSLIRLELADLPQGYLQVDESEINQMGFDVESLLESITTPLAKAKPQNLGIFAKTDGAKSAIVVSLIVQPLTLLERGAFDLLARNPENAVNLLRGAVEGLSFTVRDNRELIGDAVIVTDFYYDQTAIPLNGDLVISRRDQIIQVALVAHVLSGTPEINSLDVARTMDDKIRAALD